MDELNELKLYITQLEEENMRLKNSIKALRNNNNGMLEGLNKLQKQLSMLKKKDKELNIDV